MRSLPAEIVRGPVAEYWPVMDKVLPPEWMKAPGPEIDAEVVALLGTAKVSWPALSWIESEMSMWVAMVVVPLVMRVLAVRALTVKLVAGPMVTVPVPEMASMARLGMVKERPPLML